MLGRLPGTCGSWVNQFILGTPPPLPETEARLPGFLVPALTLSSGASVVDAAAEMVTLVEEGVQPRLSEQVSRGYNSWLSWL